MLLNKFREEHTHALEELLRLESALQDIVDGQPVTSRIEPLRAFAAFLGEALDAHFRQEEDELFPRLSRVMGHDGGPVRVMLEEHRIIREAHARMQDELDSPAPDSTTVRRSGETILNVLRDHIHKEDNVLFPMAERFLGAI